MVVYFLRLGHFPAKIYGIWTFGGRDNWRLRNFVLKTFGVWTFGGRDNWRSGYFPSRLLAAGIFGAFQKAHFPGHLLPRLLVLRTFPAQTFGYWDSWRFPKGLFSRTFPAQTVGTPKNFYKTLSTKEAITLVLVLSSGLTLRRMAFVISFHHSFMRPLI